MLKNSEFKAMLASWARVFLAADKIAASAAMLASFIA